MGKRIHTLHYKVVFRYAISIWKTQLKVQEAFFALHLLLKQPMWELSDYTISFFVSTWALQKNRRILLEFLFNRHDILPRLFTWCKDHEHDKWNPNTVSVFPSKCHTLFWPSVRTFCSPKCMQKVLSLTFVEWTNSIKWKIFVFVHICEEFCIRQIIPLILHSLFGKYFLHERSRLRCFGECRDE